MRAACLAMFARRSDRDFNVARLEYNCEPIGKFIYEVTALCLKGKLGALNHVQTPPNENYYT